MAIREMPLWASPKGLAAALREGLESLTITGPFPMLEAMRREALEAIARRPSRQEREKALDQAWLAFRQTAQSSPSRAVAATEEMYRQVRAAISASSPPSE
ncbi:MAG TPA: hypothetical protein VGH27_32560 [Streptosporangiaceae bacterium]|jgi:hypothetical protein